MKFADLQELGNEANVRSSGKYLAKGRDYVVEDGDIMYFKVNHINDLSSFASIYSEYLFSSYPLSAVQW